MPLTSLVPNAAPSREPRRRGRRLGATACLATLLGATVLAAPAAAADGIAPTYELSWRSADGVAVAAADVVVEDGTTWTLVRTFADPDGDSDGLAAESLTADPADGVQGLDACDFPEPDGDGGLVGECEVTFDLAAADGEVTITSVLTGPLDEFTAVGTATEAAVTVSAQFGVMNETLDPPAFIARDELPIAPDPNFFLGGPTVLRIAVANDGSADLQDVVVATDLAGCDDTTRDLDVGVTSVIMCDGPERTADEPVQTVTVDASAPLDGGATLEATTAATVTGYGIDLAVALDPARGGTATDIPLLTTITNVGGLDLDATFVAWQELNEFDIYVDAPGDSCFEARTGVVVPVDDALDISGCTVPAGDLVAGVDLRAGGTPDFFGEVASSFAIVPTQFDPSGTVTGTATLDGTVLDGVEVTLQPLGLLDLPRADPDADPVANATGQGGVGDCTGVGVLDDSDLGTAVAATATGDDGTFCFDDVPPGTYELVVAPQADADLDQVTVGGTDGFTTNSPATSEAFVLGFAADALETPVDAELVFTTTPTQRPDDADDTDEPVRVEETPQRATQTAAAGDTLPATGVASHQLAGSALLAVLIGVALLRRTSVRPGLTRSGPR